MFGFSRAQSIAFVVMLVLIAVCPFVLYPVFLMRVLCAALFACAFNLMIRLCRAAVLRPCGVFRHGQLMSPRGR